MFIWGISYVWSSWVYTLINPTSAIFIRVFISAAFFIILSLIIGKFQRIERRDIKTFLILGFCDPFGYFLFEGLGIKYSTPATASIIISTIPLFIPIATYFAIKEKITPNNIAGIIVSFAGVLFVVLKGDFSIAVSTLGLVLLFAAVMFSIVSNLLLRKLSDRYNVYSIITWINVISFVYFIPVFFVFDAENFMRAEITTNLILSLLGLGIFASGIAFIFYIQSLHIIGVTVTNLFVNLIPVFAAIFSYIIIGEEMTIKIIAGITLVITGLIISQWKEVRRIFLRN